MNLLIPFLAYLCRAGLNLIHDFCTWPLLQDEQAAVSLPTLTSSSPPAGSGKVCVLCQQRLPEDNLPQLASWLQCCTDHVHTPDGKLAPPWLILQHSFIYSRSSVTLRNMQGSLWTLVQENVLSLLAQVLLKEVSICLKGQSLHCTWRKLWSILPNEWRALILIDTDVHGVK